MESTFLALLFPQLSGSNNQFAGTSTAVKWSLSRALNGPSFSTHWNLSVGLNFSTVAFIYPLSNLKPTNPRAGLEFYLVEDRCRGRRPERTIANPWCVQGWGFHLSGTVPPTPCHSASWLLPWHLNQLIGIWTVFNFLPKFGSLLTTVLCRKDCEMYGQHFNPQVSFLTSSVASLNLWVKKFLMLSRPGSHLM